MPLILPHKGATLAPLLCFWKSLSLLSTGALRNRVQEDAAVAGGLETAVQQDDDAAVVAASDEAPEALPKLEDGLRQ